MNDLYLKRGFNIVAQEFLSDSCSLRTVSHLIREIRTHRDILTIDQYNNLLEIPLNVLRHDVVIKDNSKLQEYGGDYFLGNIMGLEREYEFLRLFTDRIKSKVLAINDMCSYIEFIQAQPDLKRSDFLLRNPEVFIKDYVRLDDLTNFGWSGRVFANMVDRIMGI
ncbi:MAG: hypothetical protein AB7G87_01360 [Clostridia bacterium]